MLNLIPFSPEEKKLIDGRSRARFTQLVRIGGGTFGGSKNALEKWHKAYYDNIKYMMRKGLFFGKDQDVMAKTCLETNFCLLVKTSDMDWFLLQVKTCQTTLNGLGEPSKKKRVKRVTSCIKVGR